MKKKKFYWLLIGCLLILLIGSYGCGFEEKNQVFRDEDAVSELRIPTTWVIDETRGKPIAMSADENNLLFIKNQSVPQEIEGELVGEYTLDSYGEIERAHFLTFFKENLTRSGEDIVVAESGFWKLDRGHQAGYVIFESVQADEPKMLILLTIKGKEMISVTVMSKTKADFDANRELFEKIVKSLKIIK